MIIRLFLIFNVFFNQFVLAKKIELNDLIAQLGHEEIEIALTAPKPFIKEISLRIDDSYEFKRGDIDVEARFMVDNLTEYKLKRQLYKNQKERKKIIQKISHGEKLNQVIQLYISLNLYRKKYDLLKNMRILLDDKVKVYRRLVNKGVADATAYLKAIENLDNNQTEIENHLTAIDSIIAAINTMLNTDYKVQDFAKDEKLVSVNYINSKLQNNKEISDALSVKLAQFGLERMEIERELEVEDDNKILDFVSVGFNQSQLPGTTEYEESTVDDQRLSIEFGLNVPFLDSNMKRADNTIDSFLKKRKAKTDHFESKAQMVTLKGTVNTLANHVAKLENSRAIKEAKRYLDIYSRRSGTSPIKILDINTFLIESEIRINELKSELYVKFYQYMYEIGKLSFDEGKLLIKG